MKKIILAAAVTLMGFSFSAKASTLEVVLGNVNNSYSFNGGVSISPDITLSPSTVTLNTHSLIVSSPPYSVTNMYTSPTGSLYGNSFLAVEGTGASPGLATFSLTSAGINTFAFTWGTIDTWNSLKITDDQGHTFTIGGSSILGGLGISLANSGLATSQADVTIYDPNGNILSAELSTTRNSFEAANFSESRTAVPLPPSVVLLMTAMIGLGAIAYRRKAQKI